MIVCVEIWSFINNRARPRFSFYSVFLRIRLYFSVYGLKIYDRPKSHYIRRNWGGKRLLHLTVYQLRKANLAVYHSICNHSSNSEGSDLTYDIIVSDAILLKKSHRKYNWVILPLLESYKNWIPMMGIWHHWNWSIKSYTLATFGIQFNRSAHQFVLCDLFVC